MSPYQPGAGRAISFWGSGFPRKNPGQVPGCSKSSQENINPEECRTDIFESGVELLRTPGLLELLQLLNS
jgi:hypothetical protein